MFKTTFLFFIIVATTNYVYCQIPHQIGNGKKEDNALSTMPSMDLAMTVREPTPEEKANSISYKMVNNKAYKIIFRDTIEDNEIYDAIQFTDNQSVIIKKNNLYGFISKEGKIYIKPKYDTLYYLFEDCLAIKQNNKYGAINFEGKIIVLPKYEKILGVSNNQIIFALKSKNEIEIIKKDNTIEVSNVDKIDLLKNGAILYKQNKTAFITKNSFSDFMYDALAVDNQFISRKRFYNKDSVSENKYAEIKFLLAKKEGNYGIVDSTNNLVAPFEFDTIYFDNIRNYYDLKKGNLHGIYFPLCNKYFNAEYEQLDMDGTHYLRVFKGKKCGVIDEKTGVLILPFEYDHVLNYGEFIQITKNKLKGLADKNGKIIIPTEYESVDHISIFSDEKFYNKFQVKKDNKYGLFDKEGKTIIPILYEYLNEFQRKYLIAKTSTHFGLYNASGKMVLDTIYDFIEMPTAYKSNLFYTFKNKNIGLIDTNASVWLENTISKKYTIPNTINELEQTVYNSTNIYNGVVNLDGKTGVINLYKAKMALPFMYDKVLNMISNNYDTTSFFLIKNKGKFGVVNHNNKTIIATSYDSLSFMLANSDYELNNLKSKLIVAKKNGKYGAINFLNETIIPFQYNELTKIASEGLFKAKINNAYALINMENKPINKQPFDEIANFEHNKQALTFFNGKMRVINSKGIFLTESVPMKPHQGFSDFASLKEALKIALESKNDKLLLEFIQKISPSEHLMYFFKNSNDNKLVSLSENVDDEKIKSIYYNYLMSCKMELQKNGFKFFLDEEDYLRYDNGITTNKRLNYSGYGNYYLDAILKNCIRINGYWISGFFLQNKFNDR